MKHTTLLLLLAGIALTVLSGCAGKKTVAPEPVAAVEATAAAPAAAAAPAESIAMSSAATVATLDGRQLETIYFDYDAFTLTPAARQALERNAAWLQANPTVKVTIEGHCDERGSDEYNLALGERRAVAVKNQLVRLGIADDRLATISYGEERPAVAGHDEAAWSKNRRAEFK